MNKKNWVWVSLSIFILIIIVLLIIFVPKCNKELSSEEILNIIQPEIDNYCSVLASNVLHSACPTCQNQNNLKYVPLPELLQEGSTVNVYSFVKENKIYETSLILKVIYGRNNRPGFATGEFKIDKKGNLIESNIQELGCA